MRSTRQRLRDPILVMAPTGPLNSTSPRSRSILNILPSCHLTIQIMEHSTCASCRFYSEENSIALVMHFNVYFIDDSPDKTKMLPNFLEWLHDKFVGVTFSAGFKNPIKDG